MNDAYLERFLTEGARTAKRSEIRDLLRVAGEPGMISLAGGLPSPETFPIEELTGLLPRVLNTHGATALQYGTTEGDTGLREALVELHADDGLRDLTIDHVLPTSSSQQGLDLVSRVFLERGDTAFVGLPSYLGALGAFSAAGARMIGVPLDDAGMRTDLLEERLIEARRHGDRTKLVYLVPDFQNPAGVSLSLGRRLEVLQIASAFDLLVIEDSPYRHLRYAGEPLPTLQELDTDGRVVSLFTFSKILFPGLRLGWFVAQPQIITRFVVAKQAMDLCSSGLAQAIAREYLKTNDLSRHVAHACTIYGARRARMLDALETHMRPEWRVRWTHPEGGLFLWMTLPEWMDSRELLRASLAEKVAFVSGRAFHCDGGGANTLRLNFSYPTPEEIGVAIERLSSALAKTIAGSRQAVSRARGRAPSPGQHGQSMARAASS